MKQGMTIQDTLKEIMRQSTAKADYITLPIIERIPDAIYESCQVTDDHLYIKVVNPRLTADVVPGDTVQAGVVISNSETGQGSVCVQPLIYRLVCSNGMTVNEARTRRAHVGRVNSSDENFLLFFMPKPEGFYSVLYIGQGALDLAGRLEQGLDFVHA